MAAAAAFGLAAGALIGRKPGVALAAAAAGVLACMRRPRAQAAAREHPLEMIEEAVGPDHGAQAGMPMMETSEEAASREVEELPMPEVDPMPAVPDDVAVTEEDGLDNLAELFFPEISETREPTRVRLFEPVMEIPDEIRIEEEPEPPSLAEPQTIKPRPRSDMSTVLLKARPAPAGEQGKVSISPVSATGSGEGDEPKTANAPDPTVDVPAIADVAPLRAPVQKPRRHTARKSFWQWWK